MQIFLEGNWLGRKRSLVIRKIHGEKTVKLSIQWQNPGEGLIQFENIDILASELKQALRSVDQR